MDEKRLADMRESYDRVAEEYVRRIYDELAGKPFDREALDRFAERLRGRGVVCDMGCGPGHIARYLADRGLPVVGVDLSPGMLEQAAALNPDLSFYRGNMLALEEPDDTWAGIVAFYAIIHIPRAEILAALGELRRVLKLGGLLLLAFHIGDAEGHETEMWGHEVAIHYTFYGAAEMAGYLEAAGYVVEEIAEREPYAPDVEYQSRRAYLLARNEASTDFAD